MHIIGPSNTCAVCAKFAVDFVAAGTSCLLCILLAQQRLSSPISDQIITTFESVIKLQIWHRSSNASAAKLGQCCLQDSDCQICKVIASCSCLCTLQKSDGQLTPLPLSAVALGKAPERSGSIPTGSDILLDALREEEVAAQAQQFLETDQGQAMLRQEPVKD